tara:strand:- start:1534 stop:2478 length:945 start_codon:yes stop_codon:yes gene_type:complete
MYFKKKIIVSATILLIIFLNMKHSYGLENKILFKIENEIITTIDIFEEIKFLKKFNQETNNLSEAELFEISKNSILRDKIKKIEIMNFVKELKVEEKYLTQFIRNKYTQKGFDSIENFEKYLRENELNIKLIKEKFTIEIIWNDLIYQKFNKKIVIDKEKIKNEILQNPQKENQRELLLSEIVFNSNNKTDFKNKYEKILFDIEKIGFKKTALIHSDSSTASNGGLIGWVNEDNLSQAIKKVISKLQSGQFTKPIRTSSGFIIIKIEEEKKYTSKLNLDDKINEVIRFKTNDQLNQFSNMYFNKLKKNFIIYDL